RRPPGPRRGRGGARGADRGAARGDRASVLRRAVGPRGRRGHGQAGGNGPRSPVPGDRRASAAPRDRWPGPDHRAGAGPTGPRARDAGAKSRLMDDEYVEVGAPGDMEVYRRLDAFADARLAPDPVAMRRIRARLIDAAAAQAEALGFDRAGA